MKPFAKKALSVQDISCYGQCSNTVMLPLLSACGIETVMLPTALLSTHTGGFKGFTFLDLTDEMEKILNHFSSLSLRFDYLTTGYFGSAKQIDLVLEKVPALLSENAFRLVDPVLGDDGKLYCIYDDAYVAKMRELCVGADLITPNLTEACLVAGVPAPADNRASDALVAALFEKLHALRVKKVLLTGVRFGQDEIGVIGSENGKTFIAKAPYVDRHIHGTGDTLTGALLGSLAAGLSFEAASQKAVRFVSDCIADTLPIMDSHWYGLCFEGRLGDLTSL